MCTWYIYIAGKTINIFHFLKYMQCLNEQHYLDLCLDMSQFSTQSLIGSCFSVSKFYHEVYFFGIM